MTRSLPVLVALLALLACAAPAGAATGPFEPNDNVFAAAGPLLGGRTYHARQETADDVDWYRFYSAGPRKIDLAIAKGRGRQIDTLEAELFDDAGHTVDSVLIGSGETVHMRFTAPGRTTYRLKVDSACDPSCSTGAPYTLRIEPPDAVTSQPPPQGPHLELDAGCYYAQRPAQLLIQGFAARTALHATLGSRTLRAPRTDRLGFARLGFTVPSLGRRRAEVSRTIAVSDGEHRATIQLHFTSFDFAVSPRAGNPRRHVVVTVHGFGASRTLYAHYLRPRTHLAIKSVRIGQLGGACGSARLRLAHFFPFYPRHGNWLIQFDTVRHYHRGARPNVIYGATVR